MFTTPILFLVFNRPDTTGKVFEQIRNIKPSYLYLVADGPRNNIPGENILCEEVRNIVLSSIDWDCKVTTLLRDENRGCGKGVSEAITWFFDNVEEGIILEDDCLPDSSFFDYCKSLLSRYRDNELIMHIGASNFQFGKIRGEGDYYYSKLVHVWGWATWRRAWKKYEFDLNKASPINLTQYNQAFNYNNHFIDYYKNIFLQVAEKKIDTWDYQWLFAIIRNNALAICPNVNLVQNIGFGENATHTKEAIKWIDLNKSSSLNSVIEPKKIRIHHKADEFTLKNIMNIGMNNKNRILSKLKSIYEIGKGRLRYII